MSEETKLPEIRVGYCKLIKAENTNLVANVRVDQENTFSHWFTARKSKQDSGPKFWFHSKNRQGVHQEDGSYKNYDDFQFRNDTIRQHYEDAMTKAVEEALSK